MASANRGEAVQKLTQQDWVNREYIEIITISIKKITDFLNSFDLSCRSKLAGLNEKLTILERKIDYLEACTLKAKPVIEQSKRSLYYWINLQFNVVDRDRRKLIGPDLSCAEWILRNGGSVKWKKGTVTDYNELPQDTKDFHLNEIDASDTNIMKAGFEHFQGCKYIEKLKLHKCIYINDECLQGLHVLKDSLKHLTISSCKEVTDAGILQLIVLKKLQTLVLADLPGVKNMSVTIQDLQKCLGQCKIQ